MTTVFLLHHERRVPPPADAKLCGVYSTRSAAEAARARLVAKPGFRDTPASFSIDEYQLDHDHWTEGFGIADDASASARESYGVTCGFCYNAVVPAGEDPEDPVELFVRGAQSETEQGLYAHARCLRAAVHSRVPMLLGLPDAG